MSLILLRNAELYGPEHLGRRDLLIAGERVVALSEREESLPALADRYAVGDHDLAGARVIPGLVDAHVHVTGGGGEGGFSSRVPPLSLTDLSCAGVTSVVGLLGTDATTRTMRELVARTYALREEGLSAWCWTGSYEIPVKTLTGSIRDDLAFVEAVIGVGELAISDHRSSQPTLDELLRVAADVHVGAMIGSKAGVLHLHLGDGPRGLELIRRALERSELPGRVFHPTHLNRRRELFDEAKALAAELGPGGPCFDVSAFPAEDVGEGLSAAAAILEWARAGLALERLTCSSDGGGCMPHFDGQGQLSSYGVGQASTLLETLAELVGSGELRLEEILPCFTRNVARLLKLRGKGELRPGADADLLVLDKDLGLDAVLARGRWLMRGGEALVRGPFSPCA